MNQQQQYLEPASASIVTFPMAASPLRSAITADTLAAAEPASAMAPADPHALHAELTRFAARRLKPGLPQADWEHAVRDEARLRLVEGAWLEGERRAVAAQLADVPATDPDAFIAWFEGLREHGPGQGDALFPWLAEHADAAQMKWFLTQEVAGEAGFEDLVALTQVRVPHGPKLEMASNYWDEMGCGHYKGMHGVMFTHVVDELALKPTLEGTVWESLALANLMVGLACNRRYAWQSVGALGAIEMTAPTRVDKVNAGLKRLGVSPRGRTYFQLHAGLDIKHSEAWNREVLRPLVSEGPAVALALAEGALLRLTAGARTFERYRRELGLGQQ